MTDVYLVRRKAASHEAMLWDGKNTDEVVLWAQGGWKEQGIWIKQAFDPAISGPVSVLMLPFDGEVPLGGWIVKTSDKLIFGGVGSDIWDRFDPLETRLIDAA